MSGLKAVNSTVLADCTLVYLAADVKAALKTMRRVVKDHPMKHRFDGKRTAEFIRGYYQACKDLGAALDAMRKETP